MSARRDLVRAVVGDGTAVRVDPIACAAHGLCAELLPEAVTLDEWGYPVVDGRRLTAEEVRHARRAAAACPTLALRLERVAGTLAGPPPGH
ncbi:Ferredoxin [Actinopolymorpha cephalotaxi]|uniref:Ferredoxin n=1 Tax=Actinopolymorpha cephalotaxi TaxID=504797 RepID=A0A1I2T6E7_9ACTN|nr:ferredoxin [Actinopolymorpha cephalotaxi]NYH82950.1 ferredoxin [Actinopolymorpha cephalotaxi]SFG60420.1 Ferredoxin [Actinopolymorpha cephalotaxi]